MRVIPLSREIYRRIHMLKMAKFKLHFFFFIMNKNVTTHSIHLFKNYKSDISRVTERMFMCKENFMDFSIILYSTCQNSLKKTPKLHLSCNFVGLYGRGFFDGEVLSLFKCLATKLTHLIKDIVGSYND